MAVPMKKLVIDGIEYEVVDEVARNAGGSGSGMSLAAKLALLNCFKHTAWIDEHGEEYLDALESALFPPVALVSIDAVYTQSGTVYDNASLNDLKEDLVVTATYEDQSTEVVTDYVLSGTLTAGTSTITVAYGEETDTFTVTVTAAPADIIQTGGTIYIIDALVTKSDSTLIFS